jgi:hypothetical protein
MNELILRPELLLETFIPIELLSVKPSNILGNRWWEENRKLTYERHDRHCVVCGEHHPELRGLHCHEVYTVDYGRNALQFDLDRLTHHLNPLCFWCHMFAHANRNAYLGRQQWGDDTQEQIVKHG